MALSEVRNVDGFCSYIRYLWKVFRSTCLSILNARQPCPQKSRPSVPPRPWRRNQTLASRRGAGSCQNWRKMGLSSQGRSCGVTGVSFNSTFSCGGAQQLMFSSVYLNGNNVCQPFLTISSSCFAHLKPSTGKRTCLL